MTPELNKTEEYPTQPNRTQRGASAPGAADNPRRPNRKKREPLLARFEMHICVPGTGAKGASLKSRVEPQRAWTEAKGCWFLPSRSSS